VRTKNLIGAKMFNNMSEDEIRSCCRTKLDTLEIWLRRVIDSQLSKVSKNYFDYTDETGHRLIKSDIVKDVKLRIGKEPERYKRSIDAILLDDAISIICNEYLYKKFFSSAFKALNSNRVEVKNYLLKLYGPRNCLAHSNPISHRDAEKIICYSNDIIDSIKEFYTSINMQNEFNVPKIIRVSDSFGNVKYCEQFNTNKLGETVIDYSDKSDSYLWPGDKLIVEIEVDSSFLPNEYQIKWRVNKYAYPISTSLRLEVELTEKDVSCSFQILCEIISKKDWHKMNNGCDDYLLLVYKVLPPA
jgi:hypothetical protein